MRLDTLLTQKGFGSRNQIKTLLKSRQVSLNGAIVTNKAQMVDANVQDIRVSGKQVKDDSLVYYLLNKPAGVVTACRDQHHQTVLDLLAPRDQRQGLYPVGRLDRDTQGLVLITNNGPLGFRLLHPKHHVQKVYEVVVNGYLGQDAISFFKHGVTFLDGTQCQPAFLDIIETSQLSSRAKLTITEGRFHQVKKMFLAYGLKVVFLKRVRFGQFELGDLKSGEYRSLTQEELQALFATL